MIILIWELRKKFIERGRKKIIQAKGTELEEIEG